MSTTLFALLLFGCADDGTSCQRLAAPAAHFETRAACEAAVDSALDSEMAMSADFPSVYSQCLLESQLAGLTSGPVDLADLHRKSLNGPARSR